MRTTIILASILALALPAFAEVTPVPDDRAYLVEIAVRSVARAISDKYRTTPPTTEQEVAEALLARWILTDGSRWRVMVVYTQAGTATGEVSWGTLTYDQIKTAVNNSWASAAAVWFGPEPALPAPPEE